MKAMLQKTPWVKSMMFGLLMGLVLILGDTSFAFAGDITDSSVKTGTPIDGLANWIMRIFALGMVIIIGMKMLKMMHQHQYAQMIALLLVGILGLWITTDPNSFITVIKGIGGGISTNAK